MAPKRETLGPSQKKLVSRNQRSLKSLFLRKGDRGPCEKLELKAQIFFPAL